MTQDTRLCGSEAVDQVPGEGFVAGFTANGPVSVLCLYLWRVYHTDCHERGLLLWFRWPISTAMTSEGYYAWSCQEETCNRLLRVHR